MMPVMSRIASLLLMAGLIGCAPVHVPGALHAPLVHTRGQAEIAGSVGTQGLQANGAYAVAEGVALRGQLQTTGASYVGGSFGVGIIGLPVPRLRLSASADLGLAAVDVSSEVKSTHSTVTWHYSGTLLRPQLQFDLAYLTESGVAFGAAVRLPYIVFLHNQESDTAGQTARWLLAEPFLFVRFGQERVYLDVQAGLALPVTEGVGEIGVSLPIIMAISVGSKI